MIRQAATIAGAAVVLAALGLLILAAGPSLRPERAGHAGLAPAETESTAAAAPAPKTAANPAPVVQVQEPTPDTPSEPEPAPKRAPARAPLSELSLALPPKPAAPGDWKPTVLPRPVANAAGLIEARGYRIALAGIDPVDAEEQCTFEGDAWACGIGARTAFRAFLRGRSVACVVPPEPDREVIVAPCKVGKQDVAAWLVENGWARALPGGDYVALGETAEQAARGLYGAPPPSAAPAPAPLDSALPRPPSVDGSILAAPGSDVPGQGQAGPLPPRPEGAFPMPPAPPSAPAQ